MYKCSDCGAEYKTKPDYCDCGNDSFIEIKEEVKEFKLKPVNVDPSICVLVGCLILSLLVLLFFANPKPQDETVTRKVATQVSEKQIPDIESFWDNTPVKVKTVETTEVVETPVVEEKTEPKKILTQLFNKPKSEPVQQKTVQQKKTVQTKTVTKTTPVTTTNKQTQTTTKTTTTNVVKNTSTKTVANSTEVLNYKYRLRNALFAKLNYNQINGSGKCGIQFSVNSEGKLINRAFTFQSDNKSLNDEVYKMMMRLPVYKTPPQGYKGELIKITIEFNNDEYEVKLVN